MCFVDVISLTKKLIAFDTVNPPGNESAIAMYCGNILSDNGFKVEYIPYAKKRLHLVAERGLNRTCPPIVLTGHLDVVPLGAEKWTVDPFGGEIADGKLYGRGSSDMKGGVAAIMCAAISAFKEGTPSGGVRLILTAAEELGCFGAQQLAETYDLGKAQAVIVAEPTSNLPATGHKGGLYLNVTTTGKTAHSSMPELGENAIYKAARAIGKVENFNFNAEKDPLLGYPTINVGKMSGGQNLNSVPAHAGFTIDVRSTTKVQHAEIIKSLGSLFGKEADIEILVDKPAVSTDERDPFVQMVYRICAIDKVNEKFPLALPYLTDGSVLQHYYGGVPTIILGPGQAEMAHKTDEYCYVGKIIESVNIYKDIVLNVR